VVGNALFDFDKDVIKSKAYSLMGRVVKILEKNPAMVIELQGHCDNVGSAEYNMDLSKRRAQSVKDYLIGKGISKNRMTAKGFGITKPVATNDTDAGRFFNRRVELHPY
jgi:OOP family OmpA-OmpF porin